jgi:tripartite-type tricarboxylate transporter receptor subunit TctC
MKQKIAAALVACVALLVVLPAARAFPDRPVRLIVTSPAGGPPDIIARVLADRLSPVLGQPVVVENRSGGAGGTIAAKSVIAAEPDGYTLLIGTTSSLLIAPLIYRNAGYTADSFAPIAGLSETIEVLAVHPSLQAGSVAELVKLANRSRARCATAPPGSARCRISRANS